MQVKDGASCKTNGVSLEVLPFQRGTAFVMTHQAHAHHFFLCLSKTLFWTRCV